MTSKLFFQCYLTLNYHIVLTLSVIIPAVLNTQPAFTCSELTITLEKGMENVQS